MPGSIIAVVATGVNRLSPAAGTRCDHLLRAAVALDRAPVGRQEPAEIVLVLDATTLGERWTILSISVVIRSCAIPVAWKVLGEHEKGSWRTHWKRKRECFAGKQSRLTCTLLMHWEAGYEHPWAVLTDLSPEQAEVSWYGMKKPIPKRRFDPP